MSGLCQVYIPAKLCPVSGLLYLVPQSVFSENTTYAFGFAAVSLGQPAYLFTLFPVTDYLMADRLTMLQSCLTA